jgi:hypothetical protein
MTKEWRFEKRQISAETAQKLAESLNMPLERIMHMPQHILLAKLDKFFSCETVLPKFSLRKKEAGSHRFRLPHIYMREFW